MTIESVLAIAIAGLKFANSNHLLFGPFHSFRRDLFQDRRSWKMKKLFGVCAAVLAVVAFSNLARADDYEVTRTQNGFTIKDTTQSNAALLALQIQVAQQQADAQAWQAAHGLVVSILNVKCNRAQSLEKYYADGRIETADMDDTLTDETELKLAKKKWKLQGGLTINDYCGSNIKQW